MKNLLLFLCFTVVFFCKGADPHARWHETIAKFQPIDQLKKLALSDRAIGNMPDFNLT